MSDIFAAEETAVTVAGESSLAMPTGNLFEQAAYLAKSTIIPTAYQNRPENCFVALEFAQRIGTSALMVMQNMDVINGKPSWSAKFMTAVANECGRFTPIRYEWFGTEGQDDWGCRAYFTEIATGEVLRGARVTIAMAKAEGWHGKSGSKWRTMPELMLQYRAAAFLVRTYAPELTMGLHTTEERQDMVNVTPGGPVPVKSAVEAAWEADNEG